MLNGRRILTVLLAAAAIVGAARWRESRAHEGHEHPAKEINYSIVNIEYQGTKVWVPSVLIVPLGAKVNLKLINNTPSGVHGFAIADFGVKVEVAKDKPKEISFVADKAGLYPILCQLHPAHIGGQILVLPESALTLNSLGKPVGP